MACIKIDPGKFNKRIELQSLTRTSDSQGGYTEVWATVAKAWASIEPIKGYEKYQAMQLQTPVTHKVTMRYNAKATTAKRILYGTRVFDIKEVLNMNEDNVILTLTCIETA